MKNIFQEKDIQAGLFLIKESSPKGSENLGFARTVTFKIGFGHWDKRKKPEGSDYETNQQYCLISVLTDGFTCPIGFSKQEVAEHLNNDNIGYRPATKEEIINLLNSSQQGFY